MKKPFLLLTGCAAFSLTSCFGGLKDLINEANRDDDESSYHSEDSRDHDDDHSSSYDDESAYEKALKKLMAYADNGGITMEGISILETSFVCKAKDKVVYYSSGSTAFIYDFSGATHYRYMVSEDNVSKQALPEDAEYEDYFTTGFSSALGIITFGEDVVHEKETTSKAATYLGQSGQEKHYYLNQAEFGVGAFDYTWFVSDKDNFTLKFDLVRTYSNGEEGTTSAAITAMEYSASIELPTPTV